MDLDETITAHELGAELLQNLIRACFPERARAQEVTRLRRARHRLQEATEAMKVVQTLLPEVALDALPLADLRALGEDLGRQVRTLTEAHRLD